MELMLIHINYPYYTDLSFNFFNLFSIFYHFLGNINHVKLS